MALNEFITKFGADTTEFVNGMNVMDKTVEGHAKKTDSAFKKVGAAIAGYLSFAAIKSLATATLSYFDNLQHKAEQLGQSVSFVAAFEDQFRAVGGTIQQADKAISDFSRKWGEAQKGVGELRVLLDKFGISATNADGTIRTVNEGMLLFADAIAKTNDPAEKLLLSTKAFGEEGGVKMVEILNQGAEGMAKFIAQFQLANPEIDQHAKELSAASQQITDLKEGIIIFAGTWIGKIREMFGDGLQKGIATFQSMVEGVFFSLIATSLKFTEKLTFGMVDAEAMIEEERAKLDAKQQARFAKIIEKAQEREQAEEEVNESIVKQSDSYKNQILEIERLRKDEAKRAREAEAQAREIDARLEEFFGDINSQSGAIADRNKEIIHTLIEQGLTLDLIAARYPNMKSAIEANKTEYEKAAEAVAKIKENVDKATDATNDLADAAGKVDYPNGPTGGYGGGSGGGGQPGTSTGNIGTPDENWRTRDGLANTGSSGSGVTGIFAGQYEDLSSKSVAEMLRIADELEETLKGINKNVGGSGITGPTGGLGLDKIYADTIKQILDNINKELYYRAKEEAGSQGGLIPTAGFMSPEKYFEKLDDFIEKLYEKETEKDGAMKQTQAAAQTQTEATKKLQNALERFSSSLERSQSSRFGVSLRP